MAHSLIASDRVEGTPVCRPTGEKIGEIQRLMIDKVSGNVAYAVLSFGGFLGFAQKHIPIPWASLKYNLQSGAYELDVTEDQLRAAPSYAPGGEAEFDWGDRSDEIIVRHYRKR
ncbi:PRC-barrel domain containing protein [Vineibacter terrae]|uniref:PRC-barrel domain containing protein n=1 Tax=Vineibacter terrae TaxID=2586908 RepID=A0A5C8PPU3_9HYPH|nr:PRC-barrel domain-containing protein [Vineibacter terrae]TXL76754.1 PRC-barrel domain containing protein [Vineibacter terrae]